MHFYLVEDDGTSKVVVAHSKNEAFNISAKHDFGRICEGDYEITMLVPNHYKEAQIIVEER